MIVNWLSASCQMLLPHSYKCWKSWSTVHLLVLQTHNEIMCVCVHYIANKQVETQVQDTGKQLDKRVDCAAVVNWSGKPSGPGWEVSKEKEGEGQKEREPQATISLHLVQNTQETDHSYFWILTLPIGTLPHLCRSLHGLVPTYFVSDLPHH